MKKHILIAILGLLCAFIDINYIGFLIALNLIVVLVCAAFPFMKKNYIFFLLLIVNLALYLNNITADNIATNFLSKSRPNSIKPNTMI